MFQDIAGFHAKTIGIGALELEEKGLFWIVSKIRLVIKKRPLVQETLEETTWIQPAEKVVCERDWALTQDGEQIAYVKSMWALLRREDFRPVLMSGVYPDSDFAIAPPDSEPFTRISKKFENAEPIGEYRIRSVDIDRGGHFNNGNYVKAMLGCFTCAQIAEMGISELDLQYHLQCYEGETIRFVRRPSEDWLMEIGALNEEGKVCFTAALK
jgi:acyl-ACP thioesterase